jgi:hypothetical protein
MMDIIVESVKKLEDLLEHSGCSDGGVLLDVDPDAVNCQFERGACMTAVFGGKCGVFTTFDPIRARTKISFMFDAPLDTPAVRGAACAIINVTAGFFCLVRVLRPCNEAAHTSCRKKLAEEITGKKISCLGPATQIETITGISLIPDYAHADVILISGDGLVEETTGDIITKYRKDKRIICTGPSTAGISRLFELEHWCPFGCC